MFARVVGQVVQLDVPVFKIFEKLPIAPADGTDRAGCLVIMRIVPV